MTFKIVKVSQSHLNNFLRLGCWLCGESFGVKVGDLIVKKHVKKSKFAHVNCAIQKNWIEESEIPKGYLVAIPMQS